MAHVVNYIVGSYSELHCDNWGIYAKTNTIHKMFL